MDNAEKNNKKPAQEENKPEIKTKPQIPDNEDEEEEDTRPSYMKKKGNRANNYGNNLLFNRNIFHYPLFLLSRNRRRIY